MLKFLMMAILIMATAIIAAKDQTTPKSPAIVTTSATNIQVIAYYFHGTMRCESCLRIEQQARDAIEQRFSVEVAEKRVVFNPVNYDLPENAHFLKDFKLPCPSLVLVRQKSDKIEKWKLLDKTWTFAEAPITLKEYVEGEIDKLLKGKE
jgi:hypothetical protein